MKHVQPMVVDDEPPVFEWQVLFALLPGLVSVGAGLTALVSLDRPHWPGGVPDALLNLQGSVLALSGYAVADGAGRQVRGWERRVAPARARARIRASLQRWLAGLLGIGLAGPLALAAVLCWHAWSWQPLLGAAAVLTASIAAGHCLGQGIQGRLPRWVMLTAAATLLVLLVVPGAAGAVNGSGALAALVLALGASGLWRAAVAPQALTVCTTAVPKFSLGTAWRRLWAGRGWERIPEFTTYRTLSGWASRPSKSSVVWLIAAFLPQGFIQSRYLYWLDWGQAYDHVLAAAGFGVWLLLLATFARGFQIAPPLTWRRRLAPRGLTAPRWATRLVYGSMLAFSLGFALVVALSTLAQMGDSARPFSSQPMLSALGDALLGSGLIAYLRGYYRSNAKVFFALLIFCISAMAVLAVLPLLGVTPERGPLWLAVELAFSAALSRAAIRAWAKQDLNALASA